jgi:hypothetical protein
MADTKLRKYQVPTKDESCPVFVTGYNLDHAREVLREELGRIGKATHAIVVITPKMLDLKEVEFANPEVR